MTTLPDIDNLQRQAICVYCASSRKCDAEYHDAARRLGATLAGHCVHERTRGR